MVAKPAMVAEDPQVAEAISSRLLRRDAPYAVTEKCIRYCLARRSTPWDYEIHFSVFILLKDSDFIERHHLKLQDLTSVLEDYILTSRHNSDTGSELMLSTLIIVDWPIDYATRLVELVTTRCRYNFRVNGFLSTMDFYWDSLSVDRKSAFQLFRSCESKG